MDSADERWMRMAIAEAEKAGMAGEIPIGRLWCARTGLWGAGIIWRRRSMM